MLKRKKPEKDNSEKRTTETWQFEKTNKWEKGNSTQEKKKKEDISENEHMEKDKYEKDNLQQGNSEKENKETSEKHNSEIYIKNNN